MMGFGGGGGGSVVGEANEIVSKADDDDLKDDAYSNDDDDEINTFQITTRAKKTIENFNKWLENCGDCRSDDDIFLNNFKLDE